MITTRFINTSVLLSALAIAACAAPRPATVPVPVPPPAPVGPPVVLKAPIPEVNPALPPVPHVTGPLAIKVIYPSEGQLIQSRDSNFVFGSVGNGDAGLTINGVLTPVWPNGAFMGWLANPPADAPRYEIVATTGVDTVRHTLAVKILPPPVVPAPPPADTVVVMTPARYAELIGPAAYPSDTDKVVTGYALTGGIERWFLLPSTVVKVVATKGSDAHVELDSTKTIRIAKSDLRMLDSAAPASPAPAPAPAPASPPAPPRASAFRVAYADEWTDIVIPLTTRAPYLVETGPSTLTLTLYGTRGPARQATARARTSSHIAAVAAAPAGPQMKYSISLRGPVFGYQPLWEEGKFTLRVRRPPRVDPANPLMGLTIAIDPGHPPAGATGPTGLYEAVPVLDVGFKARELLQAKGVKVLMTRSTPDTLDLALRPTMARRADAHALVSIHLNAVPDGVNPLRVHGTATYHYHPHAQPLAETTQRAAVTHMSLRDNGVKRENFALVRPTWMPAILVEGAFVIMPDQEAAMRTPEYQERYARAIVEGLENYFRTLAAPTP